MLTIAMKFIEIINLMKQNHVFQLSNNLGSLNFHFLNCSRSKNLPKHMVFQKHFVLVDFQIIFKHFSSEMRDMLHHIYELQIFAD